VATREFAHSLVINAPPAVVLDAFFDADALAACGDPQTSAYLRQAAAVQKLLSPAEMGELFKVMLLERGADCAFLAVTDMTHRL